MSVKEDIVTVEREDESEDHNYTLLDHNRNVIARVQWVKVGGIQVSLDDVSVFNGNLVLEWANEQWNDDRTTIDAAGCKITTEDN